MQQSAGREELGGADVDEDYGQKIRDYFRPDFRTYTPRSESAINAWCRWIKYDGEKLLSAPPEFGLSTSSAFIFKTQAKQRNT